MSWQEEDAPARKGPASSNWKRTYRDIGTRVQNWKEFETSSEHFQCIDCGYYWPTEVDTHEHMGRCWHCWMREAHPDVLAQQMMYARQLGSPDKKPETNTTPKRVEEKKEARATVQSLGFGLKK